MLEREETVTIYIQQVVGEHSVYFKPCQEKWGRENALVSLFFVITQLANPRQVQVYYNNTFQCLFQVHSSIFTIDETIAPDQVNTLQALHAPHLSKLTETSTTAPIPPHTWLSITFEGLY